MSKREVWVVEYLESPEAWKPTENVSLTTKPARR